MTRRPHRGGTRDPLHLRGRRTRVSPEGTVRPAVARCRVLPTPSVRRRVGGRRASAPERALDLACRFGIGWLQDEIGGAVSARDALLERTRPTPPSGRARAGLPLHDPPGGWEGGGGCPRARPLGAG